MRGIVTIKAPFCDIVVLLGLFAVGCGGSAVGPVTSTSTSTSRCV